ncbi:MAG: tol-pal system protein YbgF [Calditerrivibrio sp.]|nr:tol-pal system protein YbgF [Calditerrivibrio sp.]
MKKILLLFAIVSISGCATDDIALLKKSVSELNNQNIELKKEISDLKQNLSEQDKKIKTLNEDTKLNSEALIVLRSDLKILESKVNEKLKTIESTPQQTKTTKTESIQQKIQSGQIETNKVYIQDDITDKTTLYNLALELYRSGRYEESINKFRSFSVRFPNDSLADNALFWMGESYLNLGNLEKAIEAYQAVIENYPQENKVPDAMLKLGIALERSGKKEQAIDILKKLILNFKFADAANTARSKLKEWGVKDE